MQPLKEYMAMEIGVKDGEMVVASKGLYLYDYVWELGQMRTGLKRQVRVGNKTLLRISHLC
jgi:thymidylate synthase